MEIDKDPSSNAIGNISTIIDLNDPDRHDLADEESSATRTTSKGPNMYNISIRNEPTSSASHDIPKGPLDGWTKEEKYHLYFGIKYKGSKKIKEIQEIIPTKTRKDIEVAIAYYKARANQNPECASRKLKLKRGRPRPLIPLASWAKVLTDNLNYNELETEMVSALRLIADLEDIPAPAFTEHIDFRKLYHQIADAMEGKSLSDNRILCEVLNSCVLDTALVGKTFIKLSTFKHIVNSVSFMEKTLPFFPRPTEDNELAIVRHLCAQRNYNPLGIAEENLIAPSGLIRQ